MADNEKLDEVLSWVREEAAKQERGEPSEWYQGQWAVKTDCGTTCCIAGHRVLVNGGRPEFHDTAWTGERNIRTHTNWAVMPDGERVSISGFAREDLDLTYDEAAALFYANDLAEVEEVIGHIQDGTFDEWYRELEESEE